MKKILGFVLCLTFLVGLSVSTASAQHNYGRNNNRRIGTLGKVAIGTGAGAIIGGLIGGRRGAVVGGIVGAGGGYVWSRQNRSRYYRPNYGYQNQPYYNNGYGNQPNYQPYYNNYPPRH